MRTSVIKRTLLLALLLATSSAWAGWVLVAQNDDIDFYIDPKTIRKDGNFVRVWEIQDLKQRAKDGELSRRMRLEYDCKQERQRALSYSTHSEPMARGKTILSFTPPSEWVEIPPNTSVEFSLKIVCAR